MSEGSSEQTKILEELKSETSKQKMHHLESTHFRKKSLDKCISDSVGLKSNTE